MTTSLLGTTSAKPPWKLRVAPARHRDAFSVSPWLWARHCEAVTPGKLKNGTCSEGPRNPKARVLWLLRSNCNWPGTLFEVFDTTATKAKHAVRTILPTSFAQLHAAFGPSQFCESLVFSSPKGNESKQKQVLKRFWATCFFSPNRCFLSTPRYFGPTAIYVHLDPRPINSAVWSRSVNTSRRLQTWSEQKKQSKIPPKTCENRTKATQKQRKTFFHFDFFLCRGLHGFAFAFAFGLGPAKRPDRRAWLYRLDWCATESHAGNDKSFGACSGSAAGAYDTS